jgi:hypothetical protein
MSVKLLQLTVASGQQMKVVTHEPEHILYQPNNLFHTQMFIFHNSGAFSAACSSKHHRKFLGGFVKHI